MNEETTSKSKYRLRSELYQDIVYIPGLRYCDLVNILALAGYIQLADKVEPRYDFIIIDRYTKPNPSNPNYTTQITVVYDVELVLQPDHFNKSGKYWFTKMELRE